MKVSVQFEDRISNDCSLSEAQQLLRLGLAEVKQVFPLTLRLKHYNQPKKPDNPAGSYVLANGPNDPSKLEDVAIEPDCVN